MRLVIQAYYVVSKTAHAHGEKIAHQADTSRNTLEKHEADVPVRFLPSQAAARDRNADRCPIVRVNERADASSLSRRRTLRRG